MPQYLQGDAAASASAGEAASRQQPSFEGQNMSDAQHILDGVVPEPTLVPYDV